MENGGGYAGIHAASDTEYDWDWYDHCSAPTSATIRFIPNTRPKPKSLPIPEPTRPPNICPPNGAKSDEWYNFKQSVRGKDSIQVLLTLNEATYKATWPKAMGGDHPISWTNVVGKGRMFYTGMGHTNETFTDKYAMPHIVAGIEWAGRMR